MIILNTLKTFHPIFTIQVSRLSTSSANSLKVIRPILKQLHPDLFYKYSGSNIPETNKVCIQSLQEIWSRLFLYQKYLPFNLSEEELDYDDTRLESVSKIIETEIENRAKLLKHVPIGFEQLLKKQYNLSFYYNNIQNEDADPLKSKQEAPKMVKFSLEIPQDLTVLQSSGGARSFDYFSFLKAISSVFVQQQRLFEILRIEFPFSKRILCINNYLRKLNPVPDKTEMPLPDKNELSVEMKTNLFEAFNTHHVYFKKTIEFSKELEYQRNLLLEKFIANGRPIPVKLKAKSKSEDMSMLVNEINYFLMKGHLRFEGIPTELQIPLLLSFKDFLEEYAGVLSFSYVNYSKIFIIVYFNENVEKKSRKDLTLYSMIDSTAVLKRKANSNNGETGSPPRSILKIPHDFKESTLLTFLQKSLPMAKFVYSDDTDFDLPTSKL